MPRDRKSIPDHKLTGTRPEYVTPDSPLTPGRPRYPKNISADAKRTYKRLCAILEKRRSLTEGDCELLRLYALAYDRHSKAVAKLTLEGEIRMYERESKAGEVYEVEKENLWLPVCCAAEKFMRGCLADLGLSPLNRSKVKQTESPKPKTAQNDEALLSREVEQPPVSDEPNLDDIDETVVLQ